MRSKNSNFPLQISNFVGTRVYLSARLGKLNQGLAETILNLSELFLHKLRVNLSKL